MQEAAGCGSHSVLLAGALAAWAGPPTRSLQGCRSAAIRLASPRMESPKMTRSHGPATFLTMGLIVECLRLEPGETALSA
jgi:hypothetical protein